MGHFLATTDRQGTIGQKPSRVVSESRRFLAVFGAEPFVSSHKSMGIFDRRFVRGSLQV